MTDDAPITLGPCHYDIEETAVAVAVHKDGTGWIPVCDEHKSKAEKQGYEIRPDVDPAPSSDAAEGNHDDEG